MKTLKFFGMSVLTALFAAIVLVACTNENVTDEKPLTKSDGKVEPTLSFREFDEMTQEEAEYYGTLCADLHNQALEYAYDAFSNMDTYTLYEYLHDSTVRMNVSIEIMEQFLEEYVNNEEIMELFPSTNELLTYQQSYEYKECSEILFNECHEYLPLILYVEDPNIYPDAPNEYINTLMQGVYSCVGTYVPMIPVFCCIEVSDSSYSYWTTKYDKWFELFYAADEEHYYNSGDGEGDGDGGDDGDGGNKDQWKDNLMDVAKSDAQGAIDGAKSALVTLGVGMLTGSLVPGGAGVAAGTIAATALAQAVVESIFTVGAQLTDDIMEARIYGEYIHYNP